VREKLNSSPIAQAALIGVLLLATGFFLLSNMGGEEEESAPVAETPATETAVAPAIGSEEGVASVAAAPVAVPGADSGIAVPSWPAPVKRAYEADETVVLLLVHNGGIDDRLVAESVRELSGLADVAVFVVPAKDVARYAGITLGVEVDRPPALIVMRPRSLAEGTPEASVTYGFQSPQAVKQAIVDAAYDGPAATYYPN
jgi:hypothetical protein